MSFQFRRSKKIAPGLRLNVGKKSMSLRVGGRGFGVTVGTSGARVSAGIPGTGIYMTKKFSSTSAARSISSAGPTPLMIKAKPEPGTQAPIEWIVTAVLSTALVFYGFFFMIPVAAYAAWATRRGFQSPKYVALNRIRSARDLAATNGGEADGLVRTAVGQAPNSWTVQCEAASYFVFRNDAESALEHFTRAIELVPSGRQRLILEASELALAAGQYTWVIQTLEPYVASWRPDESDLDATLLAAFALAQIGVDQAGIALELTKRLPLRRRNLSPSLLFGLCVRALVKHASGKKASAKQDLDRAYSIDPNFPFLKTAQDLIAKESAG